MQSATIERQDTDFPGTKDRAASTQSPIYLTDFTVCIDGLVEALEGRPEWDKYGARKAAYVHNRMSDIWVRYNAWENYNPKRGLKPFNNPHQSVWYPIVNKVPQLKRVVNEVLSHLSPVKLGGVLITKIPPGGSVMPHVDKGWHAKYYADKYAVQLKGNEQQSFNFEGHSLSTMPGEVFWFDNSQVHWVENPSSQERMTMIICTRSKH